MARRERKLGLIRCDANAATLNAIAATGGLIVKPASTAGEFYLISSGRNLASELDPALFAATAGRLDNAVENGTISRWSLVKKSDGAMPQFMGISHLLAF